MNLGDSRSRRKLSGYLTVLLLQILLLGIREFLPPVSEAAGPLVLAFYYAWFDVGTWSSGQLSDIPVQQYSSADPATIARHVSQAQEAGIDALVQSWYGPGSGNQTETNFQILLSTAAASGFHAAIDFEVASPYFAGSQDRIAALQYLLSSHANHPAYLRVDGRPIIFFWATWLLTVDEWADIRSQVDPEHSSIWIVEGNSLDYLSVFDGLNLYNISWSENPGGTLQYWGAQVRDRAAMLGAYKYWAATVMPGWDDTRIPGRSGAFVRDRAGGAYYQQCWSGAAASSPDMVVISTFNEWLEGSMIEPSLSYGDYYLNMTAQLAAVYRLGVVPAPAVPAEPAYPTESPASGIPPLDTPDPLPSPAGTISLSPSPTPWPDGSIGHIVVAGDSLTGIAARYGVTVEDLLAWNDLDPGSILQIGQRIVIGAGVSTVKTEPAAPASPSKAAVMPYDIAEVETGAAAGEGGERDDASAQDLQKPAVVIVIPPTITRQLSATPALASTPGSEAQAAGDGEVQLALPCVGGLFLLLAAVVIARHPSRRP